MTAAPSDTIQEYARGGIYREATGIGVVDLVCGWASIEHGMVIGNVAIVVEKALRTARSERALTLHQTARRGKGCISLREAERYQP